MRTLRATARLLIMPLCLAGCASTHGVSSRYQTITSVGDKTLPVVADNAGQRIEADQPSADRPRRTTEGRISGRVYDENGDPVPNVDVRLAVGGSAGGKVVRSTTDRTGAFTLKGVRPGSKYVVIAENEDEGLSGRSEVHAPDTDVKIQLASMETGAVSRRPVQGANTVNRVSEREPTDDDEEDNRPAPKKRPKSGVNLEDIAPAEDADELESAPPRKKSTASRGSSGKTSGWQKANADDSGSEESDEAGDLPSETEPAKSRSAPKAKREPVEPASDEDDGPNPLPPALEPGQTDHTSARPAPDPRPMELPEGQAIASAEPEPEPKPEPASAPAPAAEVSPVAHETSQNDIPPEMALSSGSEGGPAAVAAATTDLNGIPEEMELSSPTGSAPAPVGQETVAQAPAGLPDLVEPSAPAAPRPAGRPVMVAGAVPALPPAMEPPPLATVSESQSGPKPKKRTTWKDLTTTMASADIPSEVPNPPVTQVSTRATAPKAARASLVSRPRAAPPGPDPGKSYCDYDSKHRRINDFRLPDFQGRPVHFKDLDADLILLDFWGTWCQPCLRSVPHLVDLQKRLGGQKFTVVGIACEKGTPQEAARHVAEESQKLGINYPVLLSGLEGDCPVQQALHIQAFPTLILVDREGRILWQDQGATPTNLARLDRFLAGVTTTSQQNARR